MTDEFFRLDGLTALITGAGAGIGSATAEVLASRGARIIGIDMDRVAVERTVAALGPGRHHALIGDATVEEDVARVVDTALANGPVDILVNNAAAPVQLRSFVEIPTTDWRREFSFLEATLLFCRAVIPSMVERGWGRVINVTSTTGAVGVPGMAIYGAAKQAVEGLGRSLAKEVASSGVTVNAVAPGIVDTLRQTGRAFDVLRARIEAVPMQRLAAPREVAAAILYLASREAGYVTGEVLTIDGGQP